jgi:hypothetical protein
MPRKSSIRYRIKCEARQSFVPGFSTPIILRVSLVRDLAYSTKFLQPMPFAERLLRTDPACVRSNAPVFFLVSAL